MVKKWSQFEKEKLMDIPEHEGAKHTGTKLELTVFPGVICMGDVEML